MDFIFNRLNADNGLSNDLVRCIIQDYQGFMWFGTANGLNKYDGYGIRIYNNNPKDSTSLRFNDVFTLFEDSRKNLWIGTHKGLDLYNRELDNFVHFDEVPSLRVRNIYEDKENTLWVSSGSTLYCKEEDSDHFVVATHQVILGEITSLCEDSDGTFWIGTSKNLYTFDRKNRGLNTHKQYDIHTVQVVLEDSLKNLWVGSYKTGLNLIDKENQKLVKYLSDPSLDAYNTLSLYDPGDGNLWIGVENRGLIVYDPDTDTYQQFTNIEGDDKSLSFNSVNSIYKDHSGNIWLGTYMGGVNYLTVREFKSFSTKGHPEKRLSNNHILSFCEDKNNNVWIGTDGGGLNFYDIEKGTIKHFTHDAENPKSIPNDYVTSVVEDNDGNIWVGMWAGGIAMYDNANNEFISYKNDPQSPESLVYDGVVNLFVDSKSNIWVCTVYGLDKFDKQTAKFEHYDFKDYFKNHVRSIYEDDEGKLWLCTVGGLLILNRETGDLKVYEHDDEVPSSLSNDLVMSVYKDSKQRIWVCTGGGLNLFDREKDVFTVYNQNNYLLNETIYGVLEDEKGNLWLSTANGICRFNPETKETRNFTVSDGLQGNQFREHTLLKLKTGEMLFGGTNGFNIIVPDQIIENKFVPPVVITDFKVFNKSVNIDAKGSFLKKSITLTDEITISYKESVFSFEFAALNYSMPEKNQYAYMLKGFEDEWNYVGNKRTATYTNLDPGKYVFKVKASNNDGVWNEEGKSIKIIITPPFWQTWWFRFLSGIFVLSTGVILYNMRMRSVEKRNEQLEKQVEERTHDLNLINEELLAHKQKLEKQAYDLSNRAEELKTASEKIATDSRKIEKLYREVTDSIRAAEVVQRSILPVGSIKQHFRESFILHKPKDVVSGDFYWFSAENDKLIVAAADCTGHGVSGALMSINSYHLLNRVVYSQPVNKASDILNRLNKEFVSKVQPTDENKIVLEGMDISICILDRDKKHLQFAGSGNPLYILRHGEIIQVKADRFPIGMSMFGKMGTYKSKNVELKPGDCIYLFSDGFADQFGGENGEEKFMYDRFRKLLISIGGSTAMKDQKEILSESFEKWRGKTEQTDDVLVIGIKV